MKRFLTGILFVCLTGSVAVAASDEALNDLLQRMQEDGSTSVLFLNDADRRLAFANLDRIAPTRTLPASSRPYPLKTELDESLKALTYTVDGKTFSVRDLLEQQPLMGMAVVQGDTIRLEHYAPDHRPDSRWVSFSVTKSFTSTLIGAAILRLGWQNCSVRAWHGPARITLCKSTGVTVLLWNTRSAASYATPAS